MLQLKNKGFLLLAAGLIGAFLTFSVIGTAAKVPPKSYANSSGEIPTRFPNTTTPLISRIYYNNRESLDRIAGFLDIWEVHPEEGYLTAMLLPGELETLQKDGFRTEIDKDKTTLLSQTPSIGESNKTLDLSCYRTVEEIYAAMQALADKYPDLASWTVIGQSWDKLIPGGGAGYDLSVLKLTNKIKNRPKPKFFLMAEIHAREMATAETAARFAEYLASNYGIDPEVTWLLDTFEVHILPVSNPDGRKWAEQGFYWRKNVDNDDGCSQSPYYGTDLNRNHNFHWGEGGSSLDPCNELYRGPSAASAPEVQVIQDYVRKLFPNQRGSGDDDPASSETSGLLISLHSYGQLVLWPYGFRLAPTSNQTQLQTLGRKFAYFNTYTPQQASYLYIASGTSDDWAYGELGIAAYTFEMGTTFFEDCTYFNKILYPQNLPALLYAIKAARRPYLDPRGPDSLNVQIIPSTIIAGTPVTITAIADSTRYADEEPIENLAAARFTVDEPSWITGTVSFPMFANLDEFSSPREEISSTFKTTCLAPGRHTFFAESMNSSGRWGTPGVAFLTVKENFGVSANPTSVSRLIESGQAITYTFTLTNTGNISDTFLVEITSAWETATPAVTPPIPACSSTKLVVTVRPPESTALGRKDTAILILKSQADPTKIIQIMITTMIGKKTFIPIIF